MEPNRARFYSIAYRNTFSPHERFNIGTYKEKQLHVILKQYFCPEDGQLEVPVNGYIADVLAGDRIIEIETSGFSGLGGKLSAYLPDYEVCLVYPVAVDKTVSWIDPETREISKPNRSPKHGSVYDAVFEMCRILPYVNAEGLSVAAVLLTVDEYRLRDGWSRDGKRGSHRFERVPADLLDIKVLKNDEDFLALIPVDVRTGFTVRTFASHAGIRQEVARGVIRVLEEKGLVFRSGKKGRSIFYELRKQGGESG